MKLSVSKRFSDEQQSFSYAQYLTLADELRKRRRELILFCDHPPVISAGRQSKEEDLRRSPEQIVMAGIDYCNSPRGGSYTAHEPGQLIIYPHLDLTLRNIKINDLVQALMDITKSTLKNTWQLDTLYRPETPGLFTESGKKLVSIGLQVKENFSSQGLAINVSNSLETFQYINACGLKDVSMTSVIREMGTIPDRQAYIDGWMELLMNYLQ